MADENPYIPSTAALESPSVPRAHHAIHRDGDLLVIRDGAVLPARCLKTNRPIGASDYTATKKVYWTPGWVWALLLLSPLIALIVAAILQKKATLTYSLSRELRSRYMKRTAISLGLFFVGLGLLFVTFYVGKESLFGVGIGGGILLMITGLVLAVTLSKVISVKRFNDGWFYLKGCSPEFLDSLNQP